MPQVQYQVSRDEFDVVTIMSIPILYDTMISSDVGIRLSVKNGMIPRGYAGC